MLARRRLGDTQSDHRQPTSKTNKKRVCVVGKLIYGAPTWSAEFEDRELAHLRVVMIAKLRRAESFAFSWGYEAAYGSGRSSMWLHPAIPLQFQFYGGREPVLNRDWIEALMLTANSPGGLELLPEPIVAGPAEKVKRK